MFGDIRISYLVDILQLQEDLFPRPEALDPARCDPGPYALARSPVHATTV